MLFSAAIPAVRLAACHAGVGLTTSDEAPGREGQGRVGRGAGLALGLGQLSEVVPPGRQMEDHASRSCVPTAQSAAPEESTSWALNHPRIIWLLSRQVPPVKSKRALPDGKTDNAQYVLVHSV